MRALLTGFMLTLIAAVAVADDVGYSLNPGDLIFVSVWKEQDMQGEVLVLPDGTISFPLAGQLAAAGRTTEQVEDEISSRLQRYIPDALVTVSVVTAANSAPKTMSLLPASSWCTSAAMTLSPATRRPGAISNGPW